jgi:hypothetical protein
MIERNYGRFLQSEIDTQLGLLMSSDKVVADRPRVAVAGRKPSTLSPRLTVRAEKPLWNKASPTGFEPTSVVVGEKPKTTENPHGSSLSASSRSTRRIPKTARKDPS